MKKFIAKIMAFVMLITALPLTPFGEIHTAYANVPAFNVIPGHSLERSSQVGVPTPVPRAGEPLPIAGRALLQWPLNTLNDYTLTYSLDAGYSIELHLEATTVEGAPAYHVTYRVIHVASGNYVTGPFQVWSFTEGGVGGFVSPDPPGVPYLHYDINDPDLRTPSLNHPLTPANFDGPVFTIQQNQGFTFMFRNHEVSFFWAPGNLFHYSIGDATSGGLPALRTGVIHEFSLVSGAGTPTQRRVLSGLDITTQPTAWADTVGTGGQRVDIAHIIDYALEGVAVQPGIEVNIRRPSFLRSTGVSHELTALPAGVNFDNVRVNVTLSDPHPSIGTVSMTIDNLFNTAPNVLTLTPGIARDPVGAPTFNAAGEMLIDLFNAPGQEIIQPSFMYRTSSAMVVGMPPENSLISTAQGGNQIPGVHTFIGFEFTDDRDGTPLIRVTPFPGMSGLYRLFQDLHFGGSAMEEAQTVSAPNSGTFTFSVPQAAQGRPFFQIGFSPTDVWPFGLHPSTPATRAGGFWSQRVRSADWEHRIGSPMLFEIDRDNVVLQSVGTPPTAPSAMLNLPVSWDIGRRDTILHLIDSNSPDYEYHLRYELQWSDLIEMPPAHMLETINITVRRVTGTTYDIEVELEGTDFIPPMTFILSPQVLPATGALHYIINHRFTGPGPIELLDVPALRREYWDAGNYGANPPPVMLYYPSVLFFQMVLTGSGYDPSNLEDVTRPSLPEQLTLSALDEAAVPPLENLRAFDPITTNEDADAVPPTVDEVSFRAAWSINGPRLSEFVRLSSLINPLFAGLDANGVRQYFDPSDPGFDPLDPDFGFPNLEVEMNVYISQREALITDFATDLSLAQRLAESTLFEVPSGAPVNAQGYPAEFVFSDINNKLPMTSNYTIGDARDELRRGEVVRINLPLAHIDLIRLFEGNPLTLSDFNFLFDGMDKNQQYFIAVDLVVRDRHVDPIIGPLGGDSIVGVAPITTAGDPDVPGPGDMTPPAPVIVEPVEGGSTWAEIRWERHEYDETTEAFEYQIIRLRNTQMTGSPSGYFEDIFATLPVNTNPDVLNRIGWQTNLTQPPLPVNVNNRLLHFDESPWAFRTLSTDEAENNWIYDGSDASYHIFRDNSIRPNQLYFYYVRTRRVLLDDNGDPTGDVSYSTWARATYTSTPVDAPRDLRLAFVEYDRLPNSRPYDRRNEVIIAFEAAADLAAGDRLFYSIREGDGPWSDDFEFVVSRTPFTSQQIMPPPLNVDEDGFTTFMYRISGLSPGRDYSIRVRAQDATGSMSLYTNILLFRTNMDQDDFDDERRVTDWTYRLHYELDKLARQPMYVLQDSSSVFALWYRPSMFDGLMRSSPNVTINLPSGSGTTSIFYIPQTILHQANRAERGFRITRGNLEVTIPARAISTPDNDIIREMDRRVRNRDIADYYVRIQITWNDAINAPMGINHTVNVSFAGVGSSMTTAALETQFNSIMLQAIASAKENNSIREELRDKIRNRVIPEEIIHFINRIVQDVQNGVSVDLNRRVIDTRTNPASLQSVDRPLFISAQNVANNMAANAFFYEVGGVGVTGWRPRGTMRIGSGSGVQSTATGLYGFDIREVVLPNIGEIENAPVATGIVARFGLDSIFGSGSAFDMNRSVSKDQVVNSVALVLGMQRGGNGYDFLRGRGYSISSRNGGANISTQEAIHITMMLYEVRSGVRVSAVQIRNHAATANIQGIDTNFMQSIRAAFELGIYTNREMRPNNPITVGEFLQMLTNIDSIIRL